MDYLSKIISIPYIQGIPEYAFQVRKKIQDEQDKDFTVVVDLPDDLNETIIKSIKRLPNISLILDDQGRAIPILPTDAAIEAIRSSIEFGLNFEFADVSIPLDEKYSQIIKHSIYLPDKIGAEEYSKLLKPLVSEYMENRQKYMALRLKEILEEHEKILFVCGIGHWKNVMKFLNEPVEWGYGIKRPTFTCKVKESDVWRISREIPYFMSLYELNRGQSFLREDWILKLYEIEDFGLNITNIYRYARNLASIEGELYPDTYNLVKAAKYCIDDEYAHKIYQKAKSYPLTDLESNCVIKAYINYDLQPLGTKNGLKLKFKELDNLNGWNYSYYDRIREKRKQGGIGYFARNKEDLKNEINFMDYLNNHYFNFKASDNEFEVEEFQQGLKEGIDIKTTLKYHYRNKIYVKSYKMENKATYVVDFGLKSNWTLFFDKQKPIVGAAWKNGDQCTWSCFTAFPDEPKDIEGMIYEIDTINPMISCLELGLEHADTVFLLTNNPNEMKKHENLDIKRIKIIPLNKIPCNLIEKMKYFNLNWI